jgi:K+ transporter
MKYIVRSLKYFCYLLVLLVIIILALVLTGFVEADLSKMFINGYDSLWQIALVMFVFALIYPRFGFSKRTAHLYGSPEELRPDIMKVMEDLGYRLESEADGTFSFLRRSGLSRALKMWEDRITISPSGAGLEIEGLTRDLSRIVSGLEATREGV